ncbi:MAG: hypothetical protein ACRC1K_00760 [Planctomycetia bacterium]
MIASIGLGSCVGCNSCAPGYSCVNSKVSVESPALAGSAKIGGGQGSAVVASPLANISASADGRRGANITAQGANGGVVQTDLGSDDSGVRQASFTVAPPPAAEGAAPTQTQTAYPSLTNLDEFVKTKSKSSTAATSKSAKSPTGLAIPPSTTGTGVAR